MAIEGVPDKHFLSVLKAHLSAPGPVSDHVHLMGRVDMLKKIERAFGVDGRHIFIHGERGIGKTSLARSAALFHQPSGLELLTVQCEPSATGYSIMRDIALKILPTKSTFTKGVVRDKFKVGLPGLSYEKTSELAHGVIPAITSVNEAVVVVNALARVHSGPPVVIVDEFDQIAAVAERRTVASFFKAVSDQEVPLRFIICGIGESLDKMIGEHQSTGRLMAPLMLKAISVDARFEILQAPARELGITIDRDTLFRTAAISDGFPYYVHLIAEHLFWQMHDDPEEVTLSSPKHFDAALIEAAEMAEPSLKEAYDRSIRKYKGDYAEVLWSFADDSALERQVTEVYERSYSRIAQQRKQKAIAKKTFANRVAALSDDGVLEGLGNGWYKFKESRLRGYVRLVAERHGVQLDSEHHLGPNEKRRLAIARP